MRVAGTGVVARGPEKRDRADICFGYKQQDLVIDWIHRVREESKAWATERVALPSHEAGKRGRSRCRGNSNESVRRQTGVDILKRYPDGDGQRAVGSFLKFFSFLLWEEKCGT